MRGRKGGRCTNLFFSSLLSRSSYLQVSSLLFYDPCPLIFFSSYLFIFRSFMLFLWSLSICPIFLLFMNFSFICSFLMILIHPFTSFSILFIFHSFILFSTCLVQGIGSVLPNRCLFGRDLRSGLTAGLDRSLPRMLCVTSHVGMSSLFLFCIKSFIYLSIFNLHESTLIWKICDALFCLCLLFFHSFFLSLSLCENI